MPYQSSEVTADLGKIALESPDASDRSSVAYPFFPLAYRNATQNPQSSSSAHEEETSEQPAAQPVEADNKPGPTTSTKFMIFTALCMVTVGMIFLVPNPVFGLFLMFLGAVVVIIAVFMPMNLLDKDFDIQNQRLTDSKK